MVTIIQNYVKEREGPSREQREGRGEEEKGRRDKNAGEENAGPAVTPVACGFRQLGAPPPSYRRQLISYKHMITESEIGN